MATKQAIDLEPGDKVLGAVGEPEWTKARVVSSVSGNAALVTINWRGSKSPDSTIPGTTRLEIE